MFFLFFFFLPAVNRIRVCAREGFLLVVLLLSFHTNGLRPSSFSSVLPFSTFSSPHAALSLVSRLERSRGWRGCAAGCAAGCTCCCVRGESGARLPKHLCRSKFISSRMLHSRELRATFGFKFVQKVGMSLFRLLFFN